MVTMVVGVGELIAAGCISDAVTRGLARPKIRRRWFHISCMLLRCLVVVFENCSGCWIEVLEERRKGQI